MGAEKYSCESIVATVDALAACGLNPGPLTAHRAFRRAPRSKVWHGNTAITHPNPLTRNSEACAAARKLDGQAASCVSSLAAMAVSGERICTESGCLPSDARFVIDNAGASALAVVETREAAASGQPARLAAALSRVKLLRTSRSWFSERHPEFFEAEHELLDATTAEFAALLDEVRGTPAALRRYYTPEVHPSRDQCGLLDTPPEVPAWVVVAAAHAAWAAGTLAGSDAPAARDDAAVAAMAALAPLEALHPHLAVDPVALDGACTEWCARWEVQLSAAAEQGADRPWQMVAGELQEWGSGTLGENPASWMAEAHRVFGGHVKQARRRRLVLVAVPMVLAERIAEASLGQTRPGFQLLGPAGDDPAALAQVAAALWDPAERRGPARHAARALSAARLIDAIA